MDMKSDTPAKENAVAKVAPEENDAVKTTEEDARSASTEPQLRKRKTGLHIFFMDIRSVYKLDELGSEIATIAIPAALALAADPLASLVDTAFIGQIGSVELAAVGVSIALFNQVAKVAIYPLVSVTTSFVAEEDATCSQITEERKNADVEKATTVNNDNEEPTSCNVSDSRKAGYSISCVANKFTNPFRSGSKRKYIPSVSSALIVGALLGFVQTILLTFGAKPLLNIMGVKSDSPMLAPAYRYLTLRSLGAPAVLLSLAMQGVFRGFKDTKTPLFATVIGDVTNIILDPILIFSLRMGVTGAAIAHVVSQYLITSILFFRLVKQIDVVPPSIKALNLRRFLRCVSLCLFQAILASAFARGDQRKILASAARVLQLSIVLGVVLALALGLGMQFGSRIFTKDVNVLKIVHRGLPFVAATQPINSLAFVFDGVNFGASDYTFAAYSMVAVASISIPCLIFLSSSHGFLGIWTALTIYMTLRTLASIWRMGAARGPWTFIRK
ncbi:protein DETOXIFICATION 42-like [Asparagus officinalis]|uniref:protein DETOXIFICATION 42-like n=1 Tax=Asparagus officinalis TaxID=4686 RepID=UPI00098DF6D1|nr:protein DETOXIFICATION 42-like [Asparagus officinalis]